MTNKMMSDQEDTINVLEIAFSEYKENGIVKSAKCYKCNNLISIEKINEDAYKISCPCGKFWGTIRGL